jgi:hypothetical protein
MEERLKLSHDSTTDEVDVTRYQHLVGSLHYLAHTRSDLTFFVGYVSRFMQRSTMEHQQAVKRVIRYVAGTLDHDLYYTSKSTSGIFFFFGKSLISWQSVKQ